MAEAKLRSAGVKPDKWQASCRYRTMRTRELKIITASDTSKTRAANRLRRAVEDVRRNDGLDQAQVRRTVRQGVEDYAPAPRTVRVADVTPALTKDKHQRISNVGGHEALGHVRAVLRKIFERAIDFHAIHVNPVDRVGRLPRVRSEPKVYGNGSASLRRPRSGAPGHDPAT